MKILKIIAINLLLLFLCLDSNGQDKEKEEVFQILDKPAIYKENGYQGFYFYVGNSLQYPAEARQKGIQGKVFVQFVVTKTGEINDESIEIVRSPDPLLSAEAIRIIENCPDWIPGEKANGEKASQRIILPITFVMATPAEPKKKKDKKKGKKES
ncbi:energy transducer TonB [Fulvivirga ligni]|uniref:energy transducer TonB n=1 Tax=Fulvivirga ligni TaxID=2904246 RepID=UPI001F2ECC0A|nr:energy transducer TonB [Fulvivirga ligni]UII19436.1 energy transducer TonB [Fulvivirga ligni]